MRLGQVLGHASRTDRLLFPRILFGVPAAGQLGRARGLAQRAQMGYCAMREGVGWDESHARHHTHTNTHLLTPSRTPTQSHPHTYVWHGWPLAEESLQSREGGSPGRLCNWSLPGLRASVETAAENSKMLYPAVRLSIKASRTFFTLGKQNGPQSVKDQGGALCAGGACAC